MVLKPFTNSLESLGIKPIKAEIFSKYNLFNELIFNLK